MATVPGIVEAALAMPDVHEGWDRDPAAGREPVPERFERQRIQADSLRRLLDVRLA